MVPYLIEATLIPTVLFYAFLIAMNLSWAFVAAMAWTYCAVARRLVSRRPIPALLMLACLGITVRTVVYLCSGSTFVYFMQPIVRTLATAGVFALSVLIGRPLIARFASDFCHLSPEVQGRPAIDRLFRRLTYLWAFINLAAACRESHAAPDGANCGVRRHGHARRVDNHLHRSRPDGLRVCSHGALRRAGHRGGAGRRAARLHRCAPVARVRILLPPVNNPSMPLPRP